MTITLEEVRAALKEIVEEAGPEKFATCFYSYEGREAALASGKVDALACEEAETPICIVGNLVYRLCGVEGLRKLRENRTVNEQREVFAELGFTPEGIAYANCAQAQQDSDYPWDVAHRSAERSVAKAV